MSPISSDVYFSASTCGPSSLEVGPAACNLSRNSREVVGLHLRRGNWEWHHEAFWIRVPGAPTRKVLLVLVLVGWVRNSSALDVARIYTSLEQDRTELFP